MVDIRFELEENRSAAYDGENLIGQCTFIPKNNVWTIIHTGVDPEYAGQGIAKKLVEKVVEQARVEGVKIHPVCPFAVAEFAKHPEYADVKAN
ncbi:MAG: GNAT family N-acetyltransferase [Actinomycetaceae bacterium]|nr:GNAT family N-acetyltransferase [Actinomycetaceae bacterium]